MGFFAVSGRKSQSKVLIEACHLSFWVLAKHWYQGFGYKYYLDVGLRIKPDSDLRRIRVAVPFDSEAKQLSDLSALVLDADFSPLIFGRPVAVKGDRIEYDGSTLGQGKIIDRIIAVSVDNSSPEAGTSKAVGFSMWTIEFAEPARANESAYIRFRIQIPTPWRVWSFKGWGYAKRGVIVDFRIADIRESILLGYGRSEADHIVPIKHLFLFLVVPSYFVPKHHSPPLHYSRLLEPEVWQKYLASCGSYDRGTKFSIHQWRTEPSAQAVDIERPYRAYMDLSREFGVELLLYYAFAVVAVSTLAAIIREIAVVLYGLIVPPRS